MGVGVSLDVLALAAASAALAFFCLLSSAARLDLKVSVLGERLEGRLREREWRWRLRERECLEDEYGLLLRDLADRLELKRKILSGAVFPTFVMGAEQTLAHRHSPDIRARAQRLSVGAAGPPAAPVGTGAKLPLLVGAVAAVARGPAPVGRAGGRALPLVAGV